jgi:hypothetical protein
MVEKMENIDFTGRGITSARRRRSPTVGLDITASKFYD